jgi:hypothetical protein
MRIQAINCVVAVIVLASGAGSARAQDIDYQEAFEARLANPSDTFILGQFLAIAVQNGQYDQAISTVEQHLIDHPRDAKARLIVARLYFNVGSWELARRQLVHALSIGTLSAADRDAAEALLKAVEDRLRGVAAMFFLTGGVRVEHIDFDDAAPWADRTDVNPFATVGGRVVIDLNTPTADAFIVEGSLGAERRFGDFDLDGFGGLYTGWMGDFSLTLSKGLPGVSPTLRGDFSLYANAQSFEDGLVRREIGVSKRLSVRPTAGSLLFTEAALGWLGASAGLPGTYRGHLEAGGTARLAGGATAGLAARGFIDFDDTFAQIGHTAELEASLAGRIASIPDRLAWSHRLAVAAGVLSVPDALVPGTTLDGTYWRASWDHVLQLQSGNRFNFSVSYRDTGYALNPERDTAVLAGSLSYTLVLD